MSARGPISARGPRPEATERHRPVMLAEVLEALAPADGEIIVDGTFGAGGYTSAILGAAECQVVALDRDPTAIDGGEALVETSAGRLRLVMERFSALSDALDGIGVEMVDGVVLDVGVSSMQLDQAGRGFSFRNEGPLDMRMGGEGPTAADLVAELEEKELAAVLRTLGEERRAGAVARAICAERAKGPIIDTLTLARTVERAIGRPTDPIHAATRTFQALRIAVNDELRELALALFAAERRLKPGGRLVVVAFHSLEDRIVKTFLADRSRKSFGGSRHAPETPVPPATFELLTRGVETPGDAEINVNPRSRSAKLRAAVRTEAAAREGDPFAFGAPRLPIAILSGDAS